MFEPASFGGDVRLLMAVLSIAVTASIAEAKTGDWPTPQKEAYILRCTGDLSRQGTPDAGRTCRCVADGMEETFGKSRYKEMMAAQPNPNGNQAERDLYRVLAGCFPQRK